METLVVALLIVSLTVATVAVADQVYRAGLALVARPGAPAPWLWRPGEVGLVLLLAVACGGWLTGAWLGEREPRRWAVLGLATVVLAAPMLVWLDGVVGQSGLAGRLASADLGSITWPIVPAAGIGGLVCGGFLGAWWAGLRQDALDDYPRNVAK